MMYHATNSGPYFRVGHRMFDCVGTKSEMNNYGFETFDAVTPTSMQTKYDFCNNFTDDVDSQLEHNGPGLDNPNPRSIKCPCATTESSIQISLSPSVHLHTDLQPESYDDLEDDILQELVASFEQFEQEQTSASLQSTLYSGNAFPNEGQVTKSSVEESPKRTSQGNQSSTFQKDNLEQNKNLPETMENNDHHTIPQYFDRIRAKRKRRDNEWTNDEVVLLLQCTKLFINYDLCSMEEALFSLITRERGKSSGRSAEKRLKRMKIFKNWRTCNKDDVVQKIDVMLKRYDSLSPQLEQSLTETTKRVKDNIMKRVLKRKRRS